ncbi:hypothetical protein SpCBS45565_g04325 [Spizellomyces sp. 'palustris']|nr:hypothetical protein SpCBS45565_g04325 [Spizellomyces sp. 'palustris']
MLKRRSGVRQTQIGRGSKTSGQPKKEHSSRAFGTVDLSPFPAKWSAFGKLLLVLLVATVFHLAGIYLFGSGFLLTRLELDTRNNCSTWRPEGVPTFEASVTGQGCWHAPRYNRAVLVILDALRFDFTVYNETLAHQASESGDNSSIPYYINKLPVLHRILETEPEHGLLFRVRADPPTTTLQRLKALTTGTLPTFVDAGSNFFGQVIGEDNIIEQFTRTGRRVVFMGDDTWDNMYPNAMNESYPYPSLEVWDLHTVDNGILQHLQPTLQREPKDWDLLIAHFLGVDHAGHRYGPAHPAMAEKLTQMNAVLTNIFQEVDDETVVFVIGDHGMDAKGDHGGDSENEINAGLFMYSKRPLTDASAAVELNSYLLDLKATDFGSDDPFVFLQAHRTMPQIDFVPTISMLLGIPIPFGNLGTLIPECFFVSTLDLSGNSIDRGRNLLEAMRINAQQVYHYIMEYSQQRLAAKLAIRDLKELFDNAEMAYARLSANNNDAALTSADVKDVYRQYVTFTRRTLVAARKIWARFDVPLIVLGSVAVTLAFVSVVVYARVHWASDVTPMYSVIGLGAISGILLVATGGVRKWLVNLEDTGDSALNPYHETAFAISAGVLVTYLLSTLVQCCYRMTKRGVLAIISTNTLLGLFLLALHTLVAASDSFTIHEDAVTVYLLQAFGFINLLWSFGLDSDTARDSLVKYSVIFMILTRISQFSTICREEQHPYCIPTFNATPHTSVASPSAAVLLFLLVPIVALAIRKVMKSSDNAESTGKILPEIFIPIGLIVSAVYWAFDTIDNHHVLSGSKWDMATIKFWWARIGFLAISTTCLFVWTSDPNCLGVDVIPSASVNALGVTNSAGGDKTVCFLGIPNAVGASYFVFLSVVYMILTMFQKPMGGIMLGVGFLQIICLLEMLHIWRDKSSKRPNADIAHGPDVPLSVSTLTSLPSTPQSMPGPIPASLQGSVIKEKEHADWTFLYLVALYLLSSRFYFATGHQTTLSTIQWDIGYVGVKQLNWTISPLLVILNTFAGNVLFALAAPLLAVWKRPLTRSTQDQLARELGRAVLTYFGMVSATTVTATLFAGHFRRHLMVWRVFAPKFFFEALVLVVVDVILMIGVVAVWLPVNAYRDFLVKIKQLGIVR